MRVGALFLAIVLQAQSFVPHNSFHGPRLRNRLVGPSSRPGLTMYAETSGRDSFTEIVKTESRSSKALRAIPAPLSGVLKNGLVPAAGVAGGLASVMLTPVAAAPVGVVGTYVASLIGASSRRRLQLKLEEAAFIHLAALLENDFTAIHERDVENVKESFGVIDEEFTYMKIEIYKRFILAQLKSPEFNAAELKELYTLKTVLGLGADEVANAFFEATEVVFSTSVQWTSTKDLENEDSKERMTVDKCIYMASRVLSTVATDEGYDYTISRCRHLLQLSELDFQKRCLDLATPLYAKALAGVAAKLDTVTGESLERARVSLGVVDEDVMTAHHDTYVQELERLLALNDPPALSEESTTRLDKLREILSMSEADAMSLSSKVVLPIFKESATKMVQDIISQPSASDSTVGKLVSRQNELGLSAQQTDEVIYSAFQDIVQEPLDVLIEYTKLNNRNMVLGWVPEFLASYRVADHVLRTLRSTLSPGNEEEFADIYLNYTNFDPELRQECFRTYLKASLVGKDVKYNADELEEFRLLLEVGDKDNEQTYSEICGPLLRAKLAESIASGDMSNETKESILEWEKEFHVPKRVNKLVTIGMYKNKLKAVCGDGKIPSTEEAESLTQIREFLAIPDLAAGDLHMRVCSPSYKQAVLEAMGAGGTGIVDPDYYEGLKKLADRLMLSEADCKEVFNKAAESRLELMVKKLEQVFERTVLTKEQLSQKYGVDEGEDLGVESKETNLGFSGGQDMLLDVVNIVDYFDGNKLWEAVEEGSKEYKYQITAKGMIKGMVLESIYRQFIVQTFQAKGTPAKMERIELSKKHFAGILGISPKKKAEITNDIGEIVYTQYVDGMLNNKGRIESEDMKMLVNLQMSLEMDDTFCFALMEKLQKQYLRKFLTTNISPSQLRVKAESLGADVRTDLDLTTTERATWFIKETKAAIDGGKVNVESRSKIEDIQESWDVPNDVATLRFTDLVEKICKASLESAAGDLKANNGKKAVFKIENALKYAAFLAPSEAAAGLSSDTCNSLVQTYEAATVGAKDEESRAEKVALLRTVFEPVE